jgi:hypothetical protein
LPPAGALVAEPDPTGAPGAADPPVWALALAALNIVTAATSAAVPHFLPAESTRKPTSFSGLRG